MSEPKLYKCPECGLHYQDELVAKSCAAWCSEHQSCNLEIIKKSAESIESKAK